MIHLSAYYDINIEQQYTMYHIFIAGMTSDAWKILYSLSVFVVVHGHS